MDQERQQLGYSVRLDDGDLFFEPGPNGRTLAKVSGKENLLQALTLRVLTPFGSDQFNITYGLDVRQVFTQTNGVRMAKELIRLNLVRTIGTDQRVREIREVLFQDDPVYLARHPEVDLMALRQVRHRRDWPVEVTVDLAHDDTATLLTNLHV